MRPYRHTIALLPLLLLTATPARAWEERPLTTGEARVAVAALGDRNPMRGLIRLSVGQELVGVPPAPTPVRRACVQVVDYERHLVDAACAPADVFIDDFFTTGGGAGVLASTVTDDFGLVVAESTLTFEAELARDFYAGCTPPDGPTAVDLPVAHRTYASGPVFPAAEAEAELECLAVTSARLTSGFLGEVTGSPAGILGVHSSIGWRGAKQELP